MTTKRNSTSSTAPASRFLETVRLLKLAAGDASLQRDLHKAATLTVKALLAGGRVLLCGNGGSAAEAQHFAGELVGSFFDRRRAPFAAITLGSEFSSLTAIANDFSYQDALARQLRALGRPGDVLWALSTSGKAANVLAALQAAREMRITSVLFTNHDGGPARPLAGIVLGTPEAVTPRVQELHLAYGHWLCEVIEAKLARAARRQA
jgi:D-sedoheptulose 7-phosphate isomerase